VTLKLYAHPFSSYCQKALIALYENGTRFEWKMLSPETPEIYAEFAELWPLRRFPVLVDGKRVVTEASTIIEYLQLYHPGPVVLLPEDRKAALEVRNLDRFFDNYISTPLQAVVNDAMRAAHQHDPLGVAQHRALLDTAYGWLDGYLTGRTWAVGDAFSLADCSAAPSLFYADWTHPIDPRFTHIHAYRQRLLARPSFARAVDEARPYRALFPLGAPDRD
jgi:glutathione S-transferase